MHVRDVRGVEELVVDAMAPTTSTTRKHASEHTSKALLLIRTTVRAACRRTGPRVASSALSAVISGASPDQENGTKLSRSHPFVPQANKQPFRSVMSDSRSLKVGSRAVDLDRVDVGAVHEALVSKTTSSSGLPAIFQYLHAMPFHAMPWSAHQQQGSRPSRAA